MPTHPNFSYLTLFLNPQSSIHHPPSLSFFFFFFFILLLLLLRPGALETCGGLAACRVSPVLSLLRDDLSHSLLWIGQGGRGEVACEVMTEAMAVVRCLWDAPFRKHLKVQFEALFVGVFLRCVLLLLLSLFLCRLFYGFPSS
jgi:hypothetical protein